MESLRWQLFEQYGSDARIIRAEKIQTGGLFGLGATTSFEVLVEVDSRLEPAVPAGGGDAAVSTPLEGITLRAPSARRGVPSHRRGPSGGPSRLRPATPRRSLGDLLAAADDGDDARPSAADAQSAAFDARSAAAADGRKTADGDPAAGDGRGGGSGPDFHAVLRGLSEPEGDEDARPPAAVVRSAPSDQLPPAVPRPLATPGALLILAGRRDQPLATAWSMAKHLQDGAHVLTAGDHRHYGTSHVFLDSVEVKRAQAAAAQAGKPLLIAFSFGQRGASKLSMLGSVGAQQLWFVVDAAHKPEDTASWVGRACRYAVPDGLAVVGVTDTATPESVNTLSIPIGWVDGRRSESGEL